MSLSFKFTDEDGFGAKVHRMAQDLDTILLYAMKDAAEKVQARWVQIAQQAGLDSDYILSIKVVPLSGGDRGYYVGPAETLFLTDRGLVKMDELQAGDYISYIAECSIHHYAREVKRRVQPTEIEQYNMQEPITQSLEEFKIIIKDSIREKFREMLE